MRCLLLISCVLFLSCRTYKRFDNHGCGLSVNPERQKALNTDSDEDGVVDYFDSCNHTPVGVAVTTKGCPKDTDGDGVADYLDKELITPTRCQPSDADGIGVCPDSDCCNSSPKMICCQFTPQYVGFSFLSYKITRERKGYRKFCKANAL